MATTFKAGSIEAELRRRYAELWNDVQREVEKHGEQRYSDLVQGTADPEDAATADLLVDLNLAEIDRDIVELRAIRDAIERVKSGRYGICERCGEQIGPARLEALPHAALCIECQTRAERGVTQTPSL